eukprot:360373-Chlamydomonas_euryale.AAC.2
MAASQSLSKAVDRGGACLGIGRGRARQPSARGLARLQGSGAATVDCLGKRLRRSHASLPNAAHAARAAAWCTCMADICRESGKGIQPGARLHLRGWRGRRGVAFGGGEVWCGGEAGFGVWGRQSVVCGEGGVWRVGEAKCGVWGRRSLACGEGEVWCVEEAGFDVWGRQDALSEAVGVRVWPHAVCPMR